MTQIRTIGGGGGGVVTSGNVKWGPQFGNDEVETFGPKSLIQIGSLSAIGLLQDNCSIKITGLVIDGLEVVSVILAGQYVIAYSALIAQGVMTGALQAAYASWVAQGAITMPALAMDGLTVVQGVIAQTALSQTGTLIAQGVAKMPALALVGQIGPLKLNATSSGGTGTGTNTVATGSITIDNSAARVIVVAVFLDLHTNGASAVTSITVGATSLINQGTVSNAGACATALWTAAAPPSGTSTITVNVSPAAAFSFVAIVWDGIGSAFAQAGTGATGNSNAPSAVLANSPTATSVVFSQVAQNGTGTLSGPGGDPVGNLVAAPSAGTGATAVQGALDWRFGGSATDTWSSTASSTWAEVVGNLTTGFRASLGLTYFLQYTANGTFSLVVPNGVTTAKMECWGSGAGGGTSLVNGGGGGGGGGYGRRNANGVTPGNTLTINVAGLLALNNGVASSITGAATAVQGNGGTKGGAGGAGSQGAGGAGGSGTGDVVFAGGTGGGGGGIGTTNGGGGGGGAGNNGAGGNGTSAGVGGAGGAGTTEFGQSGAGGVGGGNAANGTATAGGGGGASTLAAAGLGAVGKVWITMVPA